MGLEPLLTGGIGERVDAIVTVCKGLASVEDAWVYLATAGSILPWHFEKNALPGAGTLLAAALMDHSATRTLLRRVFSSGRPRYLGPDHGVWQTFNGIGGAIPVIQAVYLVPLGLRRHPTGLLCASTGRADGIRPESRRLMDHLAAPFALGIENAWLGERLKALDDRTGENADATAPSSLDTIARLAHDIKNAMTTIMTFVQLLPVKWNDDHFRTSFYPLVRDEAIRAGRLVNAILDQGKQSAFRAPVDLPAMLKDLLAARTPLAEQRQLRFRVRTKLNSPAIRIDRAAVEEAIVNLLANAMEASPDGGRIDIRLEDSVLANGRPAIRLEIQDSGPGIDASLREVIFAPYVSTKPGGDLAGGTGLGLSIAKHHIEAHGGTIEVESPENAGALFRVVLPVERRRR